MYELIPRLQKYESIDTVSKEAVREIQNEAHVKDMTLDGYFEFISSPEITPIHKVQYALCVLANQIPGTFFMKKEQTIMILDHDSVDRTDEYRNKIERVFESYRELIIKNARASKYLQK